MIGLFLELLPVGGLQQFGRHAAAVLTRLAAERGLPCVLLSVHDPAGVHELEVAGARVRFRGFAGSRARFALSALAAARRARCAYLTHPYLASLVPLLKVGRPGSRVWVAAHGVEVWRPLPPLRRLGLRAADGVTAVSEATRESVIRVQAVPAAKVSTLMNALDPALEAVGRGADGPAGSRRRVLTVARLAASERYKGVDTVLRALRRVADAVPGTTYAVVGDGDDRARLEGLARELGVADHVEFRGRLSGDELVSEYRGCDVFAMPSGGEGFGIVFLEAMSFGKPVVVARRGGAVEVVVDGETGFLVDYGDDAQLAERLISLLRDDGLRRRMGEAARERVRKAYSFEAFRARLVGILGSCAA